MLNDIFNVFFGLYCKNFIVYSWICDHTGNCSEILLLCWVFLWFNTSTIAASENEFGDVPFLSISWNYLRSDAWNSFLTVWKNCASGPGPSLVERKLFISFWFSNLVDYNFLKSILIFLWIYLVSVFMSPFFSLIFVILDILSLPFS